MLNIRDKTSVIHIICISFICWYSYLSTADYLSREWIPIPLVSYMSPHTGDVLTRTIMGWCTVCWDRPPSTGVISPEFYPPDEHILATVPWLLMQHGWCMSHFRGVTYLLLNLHTLHFLFWEFNIHWTIVWIIFKNIFLFGKFRMEPAKCEYVSLWVTSQRL